MIYLAFFDQQNLHRKLISLYDTSHQEDLLLYLISQAQHYVPAMYVSLQVYMQ